MFFRRSPCAQASASAKEPAATYDPSTIPINKETGHRRKSVHHWYHRYAEVKLTGFVYRQYPEPGSVRQRPCSRRS